MRSYERNGVVLEQCNECHGIFLDRGELERLIGAESAHYEREYASAARAEGGHEPQRGEKPKKSKKRSFLENLMEGIGE